MVTELFCTVRDFDGQVQVRNLRDTAQNATSGHDFIALGQRFHHGLLFLGALHLGTDHQEVHCHEHQNQEAVLAQEAAGAAERLERVGLGVSVGYKHSDSDNSLKKQRCILALAGRR